MFSVKLDPSILSVHNEPKLIGASSSIPQLKFKLEQLGNFKSRSIRLFPTYTQRENQTTNHCLVILKMLYEENPKFLSEALPIEQLLMLNLSEGSKFLKR